LAISRFLRFFFLYLLAMFVLLFTQNTCFADDILTATERAWLQAHPDIRVAINPDYPPISFLDAHGKSSGLEHDYLALIESRIGYQFKRVIPTLAARSASSPAAKKVDMVAVFAITDERLQQWYFTKPYLDFPVYLITREDAPIQFSLNTSQQQQVSVVSHYAAYEYLVDKFPNVKIDKVDDTCIGLQHVSFGASAGMLADLPVANWCAKHHGLKNLKIAQATGFHYQLSVASRKDWPELSSILEKGLARISQKERDEIYLRWNDNTLASSSFEKYQYWIFAGVFMLLGLLLFRLYRWDNKLKDSLNQRFSVANTLDVEQNQRLAASQKIMQTNILAFALMVIIIVLTFIFTHKYFDKSANDFLSILEFAVVLLGLIGGFTLGSMWRRYQAENSFLQLQNQTKQREVAEQQLTQIEQRQIKQQHALLALTRSQLREWQDADDIYREIVQLATDTLDAERASVWLFDKNLQQLDCMSLFVKSKQLHTIAKPLLAQQLPQYFRHLLDHRVIIANDANTNPATLEFVGGYLQENNIGAMLDGTIWLNNEVLGVVCIEHTGSTREWTLDEQNFIGSLTDYCRVIIETSRRRAAEQALLRLSAQQEEMIGERTRSLIESESRYSYVIQHAPIPILVIANNGDIVDINPEALSAGNYVREDIIGKNFIQTIVAKESRKKALYTAAQTLKGKRFRDIELVLQSSDGKKVEFLCSIGIISRSEEDGTEKMVAIAQNISQQKALQLSLIKAREAAESADRIKSMFVASMSHELRTPLNSIIGFLSVVLQGMSGELNLKQKDQLGRAYHSAKHLLSLISDVIDISKIEAGFLQVHEEKVYLKQLFIEVQHALNFLAEEKKLTLHIDCNENIALETDRKRLYQVVLNVVSNALKYTERGTVEVSATLVKDRLTIQVSDTGIGIAEADLAQLFKPFERIESKLKVKTLGTGLGLYLTRKILTQLLGGAIEVKSTLGEGSTFTVKVPLKMPKALKQSNASILEEHQQNHLN
jgi:PAS domain S-box-containing protein